MEKIYTKSDLLKMKKKQIINLLGFKNINSYYKSTGDKGKRSRKQFIQMYIWGNK